MTATTRGIIAIGVFKRISSILKDWIKNGALKIVEKEDEHRHVKKFVEVAKWAIE